MTYFSEFLHGRMSHTGQGQGEGGAYSRKSLGGAPRFFWT